MTRNGRSIEIAGVTHNAPIPMGARVGDLLFSSAISGRDPANGQLASDAAGQARFAFLNMRTLLAEGGASLSDVVRMTVYVKDDAHRDAINTEWLACFPDPHDRPARHTLVYDLQRGMLLQIEIVAVVGRGRAA